MWNCNRQKFFTVYFVVNAGVTSNDCFVLPSNLIYSCFSMSCIFVFNHVNICPFSIGMLVVDFVIPLVSYCKQVQFVALLTFFQISTNLCHLQITN